MRPNLLAFLLLLSGLAAAPSARADDSDTCLECHKAGGDGPEVKKDAFAKSIHGQNGVGCTDCHAGYSMGPHEGELPALSPEEAAVVARIQKAVWGEGDKKETITAPRALLACKSCHAEVTDVYAGSVHAKWLVSDQKVAGPSCVTCHGAAHEIQKPAPYAPANGARVAVPADRRALAKVCESCHGNEEFARAAGLNPETAVTYHDSIHGRMVRVGNAFAPTCVSCHAAAQGGTHAIVAKGDPASTVYGKNRKDTCARCHKGANDNFAALIAHKPLQETGGNVVPHLVHIAFSYLTTLTLLFFAFHVLVDFVYELRQRLTRKKHGLSPADLKEVVRFDLHQRIQHWFMLSGVILLGITGWPLRGAGSFEGAPIIGGRDAAPYSAAFMKALFGGAEGAAIWHRVGAVLIIISSIYHLVYLTFLASRKRLPMSMLPLPKDALDMRDNILFMLGLKKDRPRFDRYMYLEKFDYWAVFWGIVMMVGTGFIFWFPVWFASWAPSWIITAAQIVHGEEATLAITFLFVVHFYNVHLKPSIFPMNWAWLSGRITVDNLKHEHPLEYDRIKRDLE
ncbi:MAG TPA: multiheme c-type cytochrome [Anaeromyxobacteraceae bacterium]|nr:multiheme c-type cytochrome [Anaeromyxobacteraceae bacterium]